MKETRMPPALAANLVENNGNTMYWVSVIVIAFNTLYLVQLYIHWCVWHFTELIGAYTLKNKFAPALKVNFLKKLLQLVALQIF